MVVKMMRWRPWPPLVTRKYEVRLVVRRIEGLDLVRRNPPSQEPSQSGEKGVKEKWTVEIRWKGPKMAGLNLRRRRFKSNWSQEVEEMNKEEGESWVCWEEEFQSLCALSVNKANSVFLPWEISFALFNVLNQGLKSKAPSLGTASLNLAEYASAAEQKEFEISLPLVCSVTPMEHHPLLYISLSLSELRMSPESSEPIHRAIVPILSPPQSGETVSTEKDELSAIKSGLQKVKILTEYVSARREKKACSEEDSGDGRRSAKSEDDDYYNPFDSDSFDDFEDGESDEVKEDATIRKSFSYGMLAYANWADGSFQFDMMINGEDEDLVYFSNRKSDVGCSHNDDSSPSLPESTLLQSSKRSLLPWKKRKLSFRSPKTKGEPLLKKAYGEEGGDDIDFDRRQLRPEEGHSFGWQKVDEDSFASHLSVSEFGDDNFTVGSWEYKEIISRDGHMKLQAQIFFASIDQRSERAAGESACTALVAVIADWFQNNPDIMPNKSQFDSLIREGSLEWRNLCENRTYMERFPDKHFDLETVLEAKFRNLSVVPGKSFIGFFHPDGINEEKIDFLHGAMSFDSIWDDISCSGSKLASDSKKAEVYIISWNDHFFVLIVENDAYYIIDSLGERLYEGCNQAYILKFDGSTVIHKLQNASQSSEERAMGEQQTVASTSELVTTADINEQLKSQDCAEVVCTGKESCKEYIKNFLAAIPIRELQADIKKGLMASTPVHQRLQIEFNYTQLESLHKRNGKESATAL